MKNIELQNFEGTADKVGEQVFKQLIAPMLDEMRATDPDSAKLFAFSILWLGLASYANQFEPDGAKKSIQFTVEQFMTTFDKFNKRPS
ncbi:hypothetical protein F3J02_01385 [Acinetobacter sp. Tr-809]|uniref:hypothetical protein n=1 Tax=Acinetobacter sp. Tr-809 TaxID=2608324 RepID=UPI001421B4DA|nr:hypothetical protein [Acinetobacter sp. Tr-809]NIE95147.1 hypothetical protein [Acinetobacter sp. Tr-809]